MVCEVVAGNAADDPLYVTAVDRVLQIVDGLGLLCGGDCKMSALATRAHIAHQQQHYLCPLALTGELWGSQPLRPPQRRLWLPIPSPTRTPTLPVRARWSC